MFECFEVDLKTDQNFLLFDFSRDGSFSKYCPRLVFTSFLAARRSSRNFSQRLAHEDSFAFFLHESFFERRRLTSESIHGGELRRLKVFSGINSAATPRKRSFHRFQSSLISLDSLGDKLLWLRAWYRPFQSARWKSKTVLLSKPVDLLY